MGCRLFGCRRGFASLFTMFFQDFSKSIQPKVVFIIIVITSISQRGILLVRNSIIIIILLLLSLFFLIVLFLLFTLILLSLMLIFVSLVTTRLDPLNRFIWRGRARRNPWRQLVRRSGTSERVKMGIHIMGFEIFQFMIRSFVDLVIAD